MNNIPCNNTISCAVYPGLILSPLPACGVLTAWLGCAREPASRRPPCGHPLIDVAPLLNGGDATATVRDLRSALLTRGYFYAANVSIMDDIYLRSIYAYSRKVHALPTAVKQRCAQRGGTGAYSGPDIGQLQYEATGSPATVCGWDHSRTRFTLADSESEAI